MSADEDFEELLNRSSLRTPGARALVAQVPPEVAARIREAVAAGETESGQSDSN